MNWNAQWGESMARDRVRAMVCGLAPERARERRLVVLQVYIDDSTSQKGNFVLAGYVASAERWAAFSAEWSEMLSYAGFNAKGSRQFKMSSMAQSQDRFDRVPAFYRIIENHALAGFSFGFNRANFELAKKRISIPNVNVDYGYMGNPYCFLFFGLVKNIVESIVTAPSVFPSTEKIDFIFDQQTEKKAVLSMYDYFLSTAPEKIKERFSSTPRFEDDEDFLPLQAADFWAWWNRKWLDDGNRDVFYNLDFGKFQPYRIVPIMDTILTEDGMAKVLAKICMDNSPPGTPVFDQGVQVH